MRRRPQEEQEPDRTGPEGVPEGAGAELPQTEGGAAAPHQQEDPTALQTRPAGQLAQVREDMLPVCAHFFVSGFFLKTVFCFCNNHAANGQLDKVALKLHLVFLCRHLEILEFSQVKKKQFAALQPPLKTEINMEIVMLHTNTQI